MRVIPVLDLRGGLAVHAIRGERDRYRPVAGRLAPGADPVRLAAAFRDRLGLDSLYVADLDAIAGAPAATALLRRLADETPGGVWVDAGTRTPGEARRLLDAGAGRVIVGLETLAAAADLDAIAAAVPADRLALSLDVRGERVRCADPALAERPPAVALGAAVAAGFRSAILLDLDRVGSRDGPPLDLLGRLRAAVPQTELLAGGGVRGIGDLRDLAGAGCAGALVATALHEGRLSRADLGSLAG